jgi:hypothetical protein
MENYFFVINRVVDVIFIGDIYVSSKMQYPRDNGRGWISNIGLIRWRSVPL